ncbi:hypothetical protein AciX9_1984 [Granulicella tundricola MP5ACTX9]|uniref:Uncharacterized protein n=1 Tax=Granulicella tundricola (strain ATCC BAA-1859 / DSM 23138 / MP5ACTX9) TaxID=1198114 RepID=E8X176_GRATM|nr:hypothetical protein AciX9_1984 [Granulicella tundricola MP5ACTX9]
MVNVILQGREAIKLNKDKGFAAICKIMLDTAICGKWDLKSVAL